MTGTRFRIVGLFAIALALSACIDSQANVPRSAPPTIASNASSDNTSFTNIIPSLVAAISETTPVATEPTIEPTVAASAIPKGPVPAGSEARVGGFTFKVHSILRSQSNVFIDYSIRNEMTSPVEWAIPPRTPPNVRFDLLDATEQPLNQEYTAELRTTFNPPPQLFGEPATPEHCSPEYFLLDGYVNADSDHYPPRPLVLFPGQAFRGWLRFQATPGLEQAGLRLRVWLPVGPDTAEAQKGVFEVSETLKGTPLAWTGAGQEVSDEAAVEGLVVSQVQMGEVDQSDPCEPRRLVIVNIRNTTAQTVELPRFRLIDRDSRYYEHMPRTGSSSDVPSSIAPRETLEVTLKFAALPGVLEQPAALLVEPRVPFRGAGARTPISDYKPSARVRIQTEQINTAIPTTAATNQIATVPQQVATPVNIAPSIESTSVQGGALQPTAPTNQTPVIAPTLDFKIEGIRAGTADGKRLRIVFDMTQLTPNADSESLFETSVRGTTVNEIKLLIHAQAETISSVNYLTNQARDWADISVVWASNVLEIRVVPKRELQLRDVFFLPHSLPDHPRDRLVVDFCQDCPLLRS